MQILAILTKTRQIYLTKDSFGRNVWSWGIVGRYARNPDDTNNFNDLWLEKTRQLSLGLYRLEITSLKKFKDVKNIDKYYERPC